MSKGQFAEIIRTNYPSTATDHRSFDSFKFILSSKVIDIPNSVLSRATEAIQKIFAHSRSSSQRQHLQKILSDADKQILNAKQSNFSALMAYDFHYNDKTDQLSLIEINTNAALFLFADILYRENDQELSDKTRGLLFDSFTQEAELNSQVLKSVILIDENLQEQKAYIEFLMFKDFFESRGVKYKILEYSDPKVLDGESFIYNRFCDFTLQEPRSEHLRKSFIGGKQTFSPNPIEYLLLADKARMGDFADANISETIIPQIDFSKFADADELWSLRKKYFFKPKRMYGSKAVFSGASISKKRFLEIFEQDYVAQELRQPSESDGWKYDLRFYVYKDQIQQSVARVYKGQVTNFSNEDGGLARVRFL